MRHFFSQSSLSTPQRDVRLLPSTCRVASRHARHSMRRAQSLHLVALLLTISMLLSPARAVETLKMQLASTLAKTSAPLSVQAKVGRWFPVAVTLSNTGEAVQGRLELRLTSSGGDARDASFYADVDLPANQSNKRVWLYGRLDSSGFDGATVTFSGANFKTIKQPFGLEAVDKGKRLVVTISDSDEKLAYLSSLPDKRLGIASEMQEAGLVGTNARAGFVAPVGASHDLVPDRWIGLEGADMVVLQDFPHTALAPEQLAALRGYVATGGALLATGGADWQRLASSPLADLWPLVPSSSGAASAGEVANLVARFIPKGQVLLGADRLGGAPVVVARGALKPDSIVRAKMKDAPMLVSRDVGAGRVLFLAMDATKPPFLGWRGLATLWAQVFASTHAPRRLEAVRDNPFGASITYNTTGQYDDLSTAPDATASMLGIIRRLPQLRTPPTSTIAWFLALYVFCLVPLNYFVLRGIDKRELAWVTVPIIAILFSVGSYAAARRIKGVDLLSRHINIVQGTAGAGEAGSGLARADAMLWLYSPRKTTYDISSDNAQMAMGDYLGEDDNSDAPGTATTGASLNVRQPDASRAFRIESSDVKMWDEAKYIGESTLGVGRGVRVQAAGALWNVRNDSPFDLRAAVLVDADGQVQSLGDLKAGDVMTAARIKAKAPTLKIPKKSDAKTKKRAILLQKVQETNANLLTRIETASNLAPLFDTSDTKNAMATGDSNSASTLRLLARAALNAAVGSNANAGPMLVAWGTEPVAALHIDNESPHAQSVTLFVFRLPSTP